MILSMYKPNSKTPLLLFQNSSSNYVNPFSSQNYKINPYTNIKQNIYVYTNTNSKELNSSMLPLLKKHTKSRTRWSHQPVCPIYCYQI